MDSDSEDLPGDISGSDSPPSGDPTADEGFVAYGLSAEARRVIETSLTHALEVAGPTFGEALRNLEAIVARAEPLALMGALAMYCGTAEVGTNPEFNRALRVFESHIELVQAFAFGLSNEPPLGQDPPVAVIEDIARAVRQVTDAWMLLEAQKVSRASPGRDRDLALALFNVRANAMRLRGSGYQKPTVKILQTLLAPLDEPVEQVLGWRPSALVGWWMAMAAAANRRLDAHRAAVREATAWEVNGEWLHRVRERFGSLPVDDDERLVAEARLDEDVRLGFVLHSSDLRAREIFRFDLAELQKFMPVAIDAETVRSILSAWSLKPGDARELPPRNLILENPVIERPFLASGPDEWHLFCGWLLLHNAFGLIERLLDGHAELFEAYLRRRSEYLERSTAEALTRGLPGGQVETTPLYTDPIDGREYEADVLVLLDSYAVVAEAKAGRLGPEARRGKGRRLRDRISKLLEAPSEQAHRLAALLKTPGEHTLRRKGDGAAVTIQSGAIRRVIVIGVTLEPLAWILPRLGDVAEAGLTERTADVLAYSVSLSDLEIVVRLLDHPSEILHYLNRRSEIERRAFLRGDEVDLLGLYLETGFNLGEKEFEPGLVLDVTGMSDPVDRWHYRQDVGMEAERPRVRRTPWWEAVLTQAEQKRFPRWPEVGVSICNVAPSEQAKLEAVMKELREDITTGRRAATDVVVFQNGPPQRRDVFVGLIAGSPDRDKRERQYLAAAGVGMEASGMQRVIVLAWTPFPIEAAYFALGLSEA